MTRRIAVPFALLLLVIAGVAPHAQTAASGGREDTAAGVQSQPEAARLPAERRSMQEYREAMGMEARGARPDTRRGERQRSWWRLQIGSRGVRLPPPDSVALGGRLIPPGTEVSGTVAVADGPLEVYGTIRGDALAIDGDVILHEGALVTGSAVAVRGRVQLGGGRAEGEVRSVGSLSEVVEPETVRRSPREATTRNVLIAAGFLAVLVLIGMGALMFAGEHLEAVSDVVQRRFTRALWVGVLAQAAALPVLVIGVVALALTVLGVLLIPFAVVAYVLALAGILTLGFLAVARVTGSGILSGTPKRSGTERSRTLGGLMMGLFLYLGLWIVAAALTWQPIASGVATALALIVTWVAVTVGLGAAVLSRVKLRESDAGRSEPEAVDETSWQTPTPVSGVVAARRPTPAPGVREIR